MHRNPLRYSKHYSSEQNEIGDEYVLSDIAKVTKLETSTEILIGLQQKPSKLIDWLPILAIISAVLISLIAFIILCKRRIDHHHHRHHTHSQSKRQWTNQNNNQASLLSIDVAECIDNDFEFSAGLNILLAKGNFVLDDDDAQLLNSLNTFDRLQYFQNLVFNVK